MKPMLVDFASRHGPWRWDLRMPGTRLFVAMALAALPMLALSWQQFRAIGQERVEVADELARVTARQEQVAAMARSRAGATSERERMLRQAAGQLAVPWESIFQALEAAPAARLESLQPDVASGMVKVQAHAAGIDQIQDYLATLRKSPVFVRVSLQRHELPPQGGGVNFSYEAVLAVPYRLPAADTGSGR